MRAAPRCRSATTNSVRLSPKPTKPISAACNIVASAGSRAPKASASETLVVPATRPLAPAMNMASCTAIRRVRLLSTAQARQAAAIANGPSILPARNVEPNDNTAPPPMISVMPSAMRRSKFSLNTNQANSAVKQPSRLRMRDAEAASVNCRPYTNRYGPITPPQTMAPSNHQASGPRGTMSAARPWSVARTISSVARPRPEPRYSSPASSSAGSEPASSLASGVLRPNNTAAPIAATMPRSIFIAGAVAGRFRQRDPAPAHRQPACRFQSAR